MPHNPFVDTVLKESTVAFSEDCDGPNGKRLLAYWRRLKGDRDRPMWAEFDFKDIFTLAPSMVIKDVIDGGAEFRNRFWGTENTHAVGRDATGLLIAEYYEPEHVDEILKLYRISLGNPLPLVRCGRQYYHKDTAWRAYASVTVGFTGTDGRVTQLVTVFDD